MLDVQWKAPGPFVGAPDPRLDPYRERAAVAWDGREIAFTFAAHTGFARVRLDGHLWWKRSSDPREFLILLGDDPTGEMVIDEWCVPDETDLELED